MEDANLKIEYDETHHDNLSDTKENMEVINRFSSSRRPQNADLKDKEQELSFYLLPMLLMNQICI